MKFSLGRKVNMTQLFDDRGRVFPVTVVQALPLTVAQVKTAAVDGYAAVKVSFVASGRATGRTKMREFPLSAEAAPEVGATLESAFAEGDSVAVSAISKGRGFQGVVKRHGFHGGPRTHGQKHSEREPGAIGGGGGRAGGRVAKGIRMAGRMGGDRVTVKNLTVVKIDPDTGALYLSGAVPGRRGTLVEIVAR